ncbi:MAG: CoB--CoM heterodisulfide reductase iron-sulfur subunit A family protein [Candidatus Lokiarchaeota archaeon]|nr:CoB--CoM heterodisulfide reductase iron-sulfur subunit A family protein [Candidatus Lokiarchaeota archaeon]
MAAKPSIKAQAPGEVLVVGMGVAGIQASLDLTRLGFHVTAVEKGKTIGGIMAQLDKTFPTNDCSLCILAPKMVEVYRDPNITLYQNTELKKVEYLQDGGIKVLLEKQNMGINESACKNCGECNKICPIQYDEPITWFDAGLARRKAVNIPFPSAVPPVYAIEKTRCLKAKHNACGKCQAACPSNAITYDFSVQQIEIVVGGIIFATGCTPMEPKKFPRFLGGHPDVISSIQFERLMCASGPTSGEIIKRSNKKHANRIAFIQCVGSRSKRPGELEYCSSVCCMYAMKEAQITKEHDPHVECYIFNPENRACAKGFHEYFLRSRNEYGVKFMPGRVSRVHDLKDSPDLIVEYEDDISGEPAELRVDLVILATALVPNTKEIATVLGIELNKHGYFDSQAIAGLESRGIYLSGYDIKPMDIPLSVVSGSAAAAKISQRLNAARFSRIVEQKLPKEKKVSPTDEPRIGVLVCHCGINIGRTIDCERVAKEVAKIPNVIIADHNYYSCSSDSQVLIRNMIAEHNLNRFIVASCTPRTHESLFRGTLQEAGLNPYLFELVNIREHASWVHMNEPEAATEKAIELIKMNIAKARGLAPQQKKQIKVTKSAIVIGGGPAGLHAADNLAHQDFDVYIVEKGEKLGGATRKFSRKMLLDDERIALDALDGLIARLEAHPRVTIFMQARIQDVSGFVGNYKVKITSDGKTSEIDAGSIIVATGVAQDPGVAIATKILSTRIYTQEQFEKILDEEGKLKALGIKRVGFIQCTEQRHDGGITSDFPNCSGICCKITLKMAKLVRQIEPDASIYIMQRGMNLSGDVENEALFQQVQLWAGVARYDPSEFPSIKASGNELLVSFKERNSGEQLELALDAVVLATPYKSAEGTKDLAMQLKVPVTQDGFMLEAHVKLRPVDFATEGVFVAGGAQWPKSLEDAVLQGLAASGRAIGLLAKGYVEAEGITAEVDESLCIGCRKCESVCPYRAIEMVPRSMEIDMEHVIVYKSRVIEAMCKGCGTCAATCPSKAIDQRHFKNAQVLSMITALFEDEPCTCCVPPATPSSAASAKGGEAP